MPYEMYWYVDKRIFFERLYGVITIDELRGMAAEGYQRLDEGTAPIHVIIDVTQMDKYPTSLGTLKNMMSGGKHPKMGWWILIATNVLARFIVSALSQIANINFRAVSSLDEALKLLTDIDVTIRDAVQQKQVEQPRAEATPEPRPEATE